MDYRGEITADLRRQAEDLEELRTALARAKRNVVSLSSRVATGEAKMESTVEEGAALQMSVNGLASASGFSRTKIRRIGKQWFR